MFVFVRERASARRHRCSKTRESELCAFAGATREQSGSQHKHVLKAVIADLKVELELQPEA